MIKQQIQTLLSQEMDRKKFLQYTGTIFLGIIGITGLIKVLLDSRMPSLSSEDSSSGVSNGSSYGK
jgi:hypothetical protein